MTHFSKILLRIATASLAIVSATVLVEPAEAACSGARPNWVAPSWNDVGACHTLAANGDYIRVASGSYTVTSATNISKFVRIIASGTVTLTDNTASTSDLIYISESTAGSIQFSGFSIRQGTAQHYSPNGVIVLGPVSNGKPILITNNTYTQVMGGGNFITARVNRGVISGNTMTGIVSGKACFNNSSFLRQKPNDFTWQTPPVYGAADVSGDKNLYVETNIITNVLEAIDADNDARLVLRYNTITNSGTGSHGTDTSTVSGRYIDYDHNTFVRTLQAFCPDNTPVNMNGFIFLRGGTALVHDNVIPDINDGWWGDKSEVTFIVENIRRNAGPYPCWSGGYPSPMQAGWGYSTGGTRAGTTAVRQDLEPVYIWNNTGTGNHMSPGISEFAPNECGASAPTSASFIQKGREFQIAPKIGYTPYAYPHPMLQGANYDTTPPTVTISIR